MNGGDVDGGGEEEQRGLAEMMAEMSEVMGNINPTGSVHSIGPAIRGIFGMTPNQFSQHEDFSYGPYGIDPNNFNDVYGMPGTQNFGMGQYGMKALGPGQISGVSRSQAQKDKTSNFMSHADIDKQVGLKGLAANMAAALAGTAHNVGQAVKGTGASKHGYLGSFEKNMEDIAAIFGQTKANMATILGNMGIYGGAGDPYGGGMGTMGLGGGGRAESHHF